MHCMCSFKGTCWTRLRLESLRILLLRPTSMLLMLEQAKDLHGVVLDPDTNLLTMIMDPITH